MKKIFKSKRMSNIIFGVLGLVIGGVIFGTIGIVATTNKLEAKYIIYTKDGETITVQDAIKDLYVHAENNGGGNSQTLPLGTAVVSGARITIPYTGTYDKITCVYGTTESYGKIGTISGNTCIFSGSSNTTYYYKLIATKIENNTGTVYENSGNATTGAEKNLITTGLPTGVKAIVYLDPTDLSKYCVESNSTVGNGTSGCMKWYAFSEDSTSYTMILDHNTKSNVAFDSDNDFTSMKEVQTELNNLVSTTNWKVTPRLIHAQEIADITGNTSWKADGSVFYFNGNSSSSQTTGSNIYYWLFDYTGSCTGYGCKVADSNSENIGYWTDTAYAGSSSLGWLVTNSGNLNFSFANATIVGVRPVITIKKSDL